MSLADLTALAMLGALVIYALLGGADFGGGVWDLLAFGPRAEQQRALIGRAITPVWEANHVWLIIVIVILFTGFPQAYASLSVALHLPLTGLLFGIVLRGAAFTFRHYDRGGPSVLQRWGRVFAVASLVTPLFLGIIVGATTEGRIRFVDGLPRDGYVRPWLQWFPISVGCFALALFAYLAAVYLTVEASEQAHTQGAAGHDPSSPLVEDFRSRALAAGAFVFATALGTALASGVAAGPESPAFQQRLLHGPQTWPIQISTAAAAIGAFAALWSRRYAVARVLAAAQVALILVGWGLAQRPYLIAPDFTIEAGAAPDATLRPLLIALCAGSLLLVPSLYWLMRVFKRGPVFAFLDEEHDELH